MRIDGNCAHIAEGGSRGSGSECKIIGIQRVDHSDGNIIVDIGRKGCLNSDNSIGGGGGVGAGDVGSIDLAGREGGEVGCKSEGESFVGYGSIGEKLHIDDVGCADYAVALPHCNYEMRGG